MDYNIQILSCDRKIENKKGDIKIEYAYSTLYMDFDKILSELNEDLISQENNLLKIVEGLDNLESIRPSVIFLALERELDLSIIQKIIDDGADIRKKNSFSSKTYDEYPLTIALVRKLSLDYIKILYNQSIPPVHIIGILNYVKASDEIVEFLLQKMDEDEWLKEWKESRWEAEFWKIGKLRQQYFHLMESNWNSSPGYQVMGKAVRLTSYKDHPVKVAII